MVAVCRSQPQLKKWIDVKNILDKTIDSHFVLVHIQGTNLKITSFFIRQILYEAGLVHSIII